MNHARPKTLPPLTDSEDERGLLSAAELSFSEYRAAMQRVRKQYAFVPSQQPRSSGLRLSAFGALLAHGVSDYRPRMTQPALLAGAARVTNHDRVGLAALNHVCARRLGVPWAQLYVSSSIAQPVLACGTVNEALLVLAQPLAEQLSASALRFVIGQGLGRIHFYSVASERLVSGQRRRLHITQLSSLSRADEARLLPWRRGALITADRAGLLCAGNLADAIQAVSRLRCPPFGTSQVADPFAAGQGTEQGLASESGPLLPAGLSLTVRIRMLRLFADSELYRSSRGLEGGRSLSAVDADVLRLVHSGGSRSRTHA